MEKLNKQVNHLGHWFSARSALAMSIVEQKLGLFHNLPFYRKSKRNSSVISTGSMTTSMSGGSTSGKRNSNPYIGKFLLYSKGINNLDPFINSRFFINKAICEHSPRLRVIQGYTKLHKATQGYTRLYKAIPSY